MPLSTWLPFFAAAWAISLSPGPGAVAAMSAGLRYGFRQGYAVIIGLVLGVWIAMALCAAGINAMIAASPLLFNTVRTVGALYLAYLGWKQWSAKVTPIKVNTTETEIAAEIDSDNQIKKLQNQSLTSKLIRQGMLTNITNPKGLVFLLATLPQVINPALPLTPQYLIVGATFALTDAVVMAGYVALASRMLKFLQTPAQIKRMNRVFGGLFIAAAVALLFFQHNA